MPKGMPPFAAECLTIFTDIMKKAEKKQEYRKAKARWGFCAES